MRMAESLAKAVDDDDDEWSEDVQGSEGIMKACLTPIEACVSRNRVLRIPTSGHGFTIKFSSLAHGSGRCTTLGREATYLADRQTWGGIMRTQRIPGKIEHKTLRAAYCAITGSLRALVCVCQALRGMVQSPLACNVHYF